MKCDHMHETLGRGNILHHVTDYELEDLSIKPSILIEYVETKHMYARNEIKFW